MKVRILAVVMAIACSAPSLAQSGYNPDMRVAGSTPSQVPANSNSATAQRLAAAAAKAAAAKEAAKNLARNGMSKAAKGVKVLGGGPYGAAAKEFFLNPKKACAPAKEGDC